jgi:hypothetical protein
MPALQNFVNLSGPAISAQFLNGLDVLANSPAALNGAQNVAQILAALGIVSGITAVPIPVSEGGTGSITGTAALAALGGTTLAAAEAAINPFYVQTPAETAALLGSPLTALPPVNFQYIESDIRRYGASTAAGDNSSFINAALAVSAAGGNAAFIPGGTWQIQNPCQPSAATSMYGVGTASVILCGNGVDGLQFSVADAGFIPRSRFFRDFQIQGTLSGGFNAAHGIIITETVSDTLFQNLSILNFQWGVYIQALYDSVFLKCFVQNCWNGYYFNNQSVNVWLTNCLAQLVSTGTVISGPGYSQAISVQGAPEVEGLHIQGGTYYAYNYGLNSGLIYELQVEHTEFAFCTVCPIFFSSAISPIVIRDCFLELASSAGGIWNNKVNLGDGNLTGIFVTAITPNVISKVIIEANTFVSDSVIPTSMALYIGNSNNGINVKGNFVRPGWDNGIGGGNTLVNTGGTFSGACIKDNTISSTTTGILVASGCTELELGPNYIPVAASPYGFTGGPPVSMTFQQPNAPMKGRATFASSTSVAVTFTNPLPVGVIPRVLLGGNAAGFVDAVNISNTGFVINCSAPSTAPTDWSIVV